MKDHKKMTYSLAAVIAGVALYAISRHNYLLFHSISELFSIIIAFSIFVIAWNTRKLSPNSYLLFIGISFFYVAFIDLIHTLAYKGMGVFTVAGANLPTQLWIAGRYMQSISVLAAPWFIGRKLKIIPIFIFYFLFSVILLLSLYYGLFPDAFIEGRGLTPFKITSEYIISFILALAIIYLREKRENFDRPVLNMLIWSIVATIASEMAFTLYADVYGFFNALGHFFKIVSYCLFYVAIVRTNLTKPYEAMVTEIEERMRAEEALKLNTERLDTLLRINQMADAPLQKIMEYAFEEAVRLTKSEIGYLGFLNDDETNMNVQVWSRNVMPECRTSDSPLHFPVETAGLWGEAVRQRRPIITNDYNAPNPWKKGYPEGHVTIKRHMNVPVMAGSKIVLVAGVGNKAEEYDETDVQQLTLLMEGMWRLTERKRAEEALRQSQEKYRRIVDTANEGIWVLDEDLRTSFVNAQMAEMLGYEAEEMIGREIESCIFEEDLPDHGQRMENRRRGIAEHYERRWRRKDGQAVWTIVSATPIIDAEHHFRGSFAMILDITERKKLEEQLRQSQKMEAIGTLAAGIAHDFSNILTAIIGYGDMLRMLMGEGNPLRTYVDDILAASERAAHLTRSLLALSRKQIMSPKPVNLNEIVKRIDKFLMRVIGEDIELKTTLSEEDLTVMADSGQIEQVLMNLATNARDSMPDGGMLTIKTERVDISGPHGYIEPGSYAVIAVSDTGKGMDEETRQRIFEPFFTTKELGKGTGLGLSIVYGIIKQHNGEINVYSEPGKGTTFKIYLKLIESKVKGKETAEVLRPVGGTETILVAEDDPGVRRLFKSVLEGYGYTVIEAVDGEDAVVKYIENKDRIQLLIFDVVMPKKNGKEAYEEIRKMRGDIRVIFSSGYSADIIYKKGMLEEGITLITKPVAPNLLLSKTREVLDK